MKIGSNSLVKIQPNEKSKCDMPLGCKSVRLNADNVSFSGNIIKAINETKTKAVATESLKNCIDDFKCRLLSCVKIHRENDLCAGVNLRFRYLSKAEKEGNLAKVLEENPAWSKVIEMMNKADEEFKKLPKSIFKQTFYRGMISTPDNVEDGVKTIRNAKIGDIINPDFGYAYVSAKKSVAEDYAFFDRPEWQGNKVFMKIIAPKGSQLSRKPTHLNEAVFPRNSQYKVIDKNEENGIVRVVLKYILPVKQH